MPDEKRFFWLKLKVNFMTSETVDFLMSQKDGANYIVLYQMLCLKTINTDGRLARTIGEIIIPFDENKIQRDCKWFSIDTIRVALELYRKLGLIYEDTDGTLVISDHKNLIGSESASAERMRKMRNSEKQRALPESTMLSQCDTQCDTICYENVTTEIEYRDRDKEKENKEKEKLRIYPPRNNTGIGFSNTVRAGAGENEVFEGANGNGSDTSRAYRTCEAESGRTGGYVGERPGVGEDRLRRTDQRPLDWHDLSKDRLY